MSRPELRIHTDRFISNIETVRSRVLPAHLMLVVKDNAYGHGLEWAVGAAQRGGVGWFGTFDIPTGLEVRRALGESARVFAWTTSTDDEIDAALLQRLDLGVGSAEYLERVIARARSIGVPARAHLKIDSGLHRNGFVSDEWAQAVADVRRAEAAGLAEFVGVWSHLAEASDDEDDESQRIFLEAIRVASETGATPAVRHLTASAASWWRPELRGTMCRVGAFCYGIRSTDSPDINGIVPVAELVATVLEIADGNAVVGLGGFDGFPSSLVGAPVGTPAGRRDILAIGETTMRISGWAGMQIGDSVRVFGAGGLGEENATALAERIDTVGEEILTRLTTRVLRTIAG